MRGFPVPTAGFGGAVFAAVFAAVSGTACGPSFQAVHDGEARFEHCYALDENPRASLEKKADCWNDWAHHFTYGQTQDRVQYAVQRYQALSRVPGLPTDEAMMSAAPGEGVNATTIAAPAPTSAFAPPPKTLDGDAGAAAPQPAPKNPKVAPVGPAPAPAQASSAPRPPGSGCLDDCSSTWDSCRSGCDSKKCDDCDKTYRACLRRCAK